MTPAGGHRQVPHRAGRHGSLGPLREELQSDPRQLAAGPSAVLHAVADHVVDDYLTVIDSVQEDMDEVETEVFAEHGARVDPGRIYQLKRELLELKRAVAPLSGPLEELATRPARVVAPETQAYFRDVSDHLSRAKEQIAAFDELLNSILQAHLAQVTVAQNEDMPEDHRMGGDRRRADHGLRGVRHELRPHAGAALAVRLRHGPRRHVRRVSAAVPGLPAQSLALTRRTSAAARHTAHGTRHPAPGTRHPAPGDGARHGPRSAGRDPGVDVLGPGGELVLRQVLGEIGLADHADQAFVVDDGEPADAVCLHLLEDLADVGVRRDPARCGPWPSPLR
ncbi:hypothetical protein SHIRM173S_05748 [Streptomyces hirsutus]